MKKNKKSKIIIGGCLALASISIATIGFSSWVIIGAEPTTSTDFTASIGTVSNNALTLEIQNTSDLSVRFDNVASNTQGQTINNGDNQVEKLSFNLDLKISGENIASTLHGLTYTFAPSSAFEALATNGYIVFPYGTSANKEIATTVTFGSSITCSTQAGANVTFITDNVHINDASSKYITINATFSFAWGTQFLNHNPGMVPLGSSDNSSTLTKNTLISRLTAFSEAFDAAKTNPMSITVTPNL